MSELNITSKTTKKEMVEEIARLKEIIKEMESKKAATPRQNTTTKGKVISGTAKPIREITVRCCNTDCKDVFKKDIVEYKEQRKAGITTFLCEACTTVANENHDNIVS